jgi:hypothetical protein
MLNIQKYMSVIVFCDYGCAVLFCCLTVFLFMFWSLCKYNIVVSQFYFSFCIIFTIYSKYISN